ncbi:MAG: AAA family ATPase [Novosphingobium sp.]|nr:AAA family ATPase [Novosphingobium sp.]
MKNHKQENWIKNFEHFSVFGLKTNAKTPITSWMKYQKEHPTEEQVIQWVEKGANIGVVTGKISDIIVLDLDNDQAINQAILWGIPQTWMVKTPRGRHVYFKYPDFEVKNIVGDGKKLPVGMDLRGDGGYVVGAGSYYKPTPEEAAAGKKEGAYTWLEGCEPDEWFPPAEMPQWLLDIVKPDVIEPKPFVPVAIPAAQGNSAYAMTALEQECENVANAASGNRNHQLNASAFVISQLVASGALDHTAMEDLRHAALQNGLSSSEIDTTLKSAFAAGSKQPREVPEGGFQANLHKAKREAAQVDQRPLAERFFGNLKRASDLTNREIPDREFLIDGWLPVGAVTTLFGDGGLGKSLISMQMATAVSAGRPLWGCETTRSPVLSIYCEDDENELARRQQAINRSFEINQSDQSDNFLESRFGEDSSLGYYKQGQWQKTDFLVAIEEKAKEIGARLVIIDNISMTYTGDANDAGQVTRFVSSLNALALSINGAVLLIGHIAKAEGSKFSGSNSWSNASRNRIFLGRPDDQARNPDKRVLSIEKSNYGKSGESLDLYYNFGAFVTESEVEESTKSTHNQLQDEQYFLKYLEKATSSRQAVSHLPTARNYAPKFFAHMPLPIGNKNRSKYDLERAMARLLTKGVIAQNQTLGWRSEQRKEVKGLALIETFSPVLNADFAMTATDKVCESVKVMSLLKNLQKGT